MLIRRLSYTLLTLFTLWLISNLRRLPETGFEILVSQNQRIYFPQLETYTFTSSNERSKKNICIVTSEVEGPVKGGGIGTAYTALAVKMAQSGHNVTVFLVERPRNGNWIDWVDVYQKKGIRLLKGDESIFGSMNGCGGPCLHSFKVFSWLIPLQSTCDVMHFQDNSGMAYFTILSKHQGLYFQNTQMCIGAHGPHFWERLANQFYLDDIRNLEVDFMERRSAEIVDWLISPSAYMLAWMTENGWKLPRNSFVNQNLLPWVPSLNEDDQVELSLSAGHQFVKEIVFFGRLEKRKGLITFLDALDILASLRTGNGTFNFPTITFMGRETTLPDKTASSTLVKSRCAIIDIKCQIHTTWSHTQAMTHLRKPGMLVVIASPIDNSPNTVLECLTIQVPFLASDVGGIPELIHTGDRNKSLFIPRPEILADKIVHALNHGVLPSRLAQTERWRHSIWDDWHSVVELPASSVPPSAASVFPPVSLVVIYPGSIEQLNVLLSSIRTQRYPADSIQLVLVYVDSGGEDDDSREKVRLSIEREWKWNRFIEMEKRSGGVVDYWKFITRKLELDSTDFNRQFTVFFEYLFSFYDWSTLSKMIRVSQLTGAEVVTGQLFNNGTGQTTVYAGASLGLGMLQNCFGGRSLMMRSSLLGSLGSFDADADAWEFYSRAIVNNHKVETMVDRVFSIFKAPVNSSSSSSGGALGLAISRPYEVSSSGHSHEVTVVSEFEALFPTPYSSTAMTVFHYSNEKSVLMTNIIDSENFLAELKNQYKNEMSLLKSRVFDCISQLDDQIALDRAEQVGGDTVAAAIEDSNFNLFFLHGYHRSGIDRLSRVLDHHHEISMGWKNPDGMSKGIKDFTSAPWAAAVEPYKSFVLQWYGDLARETLGSRVPFEKRSSVVWVGEYSNEPIDIIIPHSSYLIVVRDGRRILIEEYLDFLGSGIPPKPCSTMEDVMDEEDMESFRKDDQHFRTNPNRLLRNELCVRLIARAWAKRMANDLDKKFTIETDASDNSILLVRYEDSTAVDQIVRFLGLVPSQSIGDHRETDETDDWNQYFHPEAKVWFKDEAGDALVDLGYEHDHRW